MNPIDSAERAAAGEESAEFPTHTTYVKPDIDSAGGELMQTIRGTGGACDVATVTDGFECSSN